MEDLGFKSILNKKEFFNFEKKQQVVENNIKVEVVEVADNNAFNNMINNLGDTFAVLEDNLTLTFSNEKTEYIMYPSGEVFNNNLLQIKELFLSNKQKICFDAKSLMHTLDAYGVEINNYFDVSLAIYIANEMDAEIKIEEVQKIRNRL